MKLFVLIVCMVFLAGCSSPQAPAIQGPTTIAGLSIPDTIDFGVVRVGVAKYTNITFRNIGSDTIQITSQAFSNSSFKLTDTSLRQFPISPGGIKVVGVSFTPKDTLPALGRDTIKAGNKSAMLTLRGEA